MLYPMLILNKIAICTCDRMPRLAKELPAVIEKVLVRDPKIRIQNAGLLQAEMRRHRFP